MMRCVASHSLVSHENAWSLLGMKWTRCVRSFASPKLLLFPTFNGVLQIVIEDEEHLCREYRFYVLIYFLCSRSDRHITAFHPLPSLPESKWGKSNSNEPVIKFSVTYQVIVFQDETFMRIWGEILHKYFERRCFFFPLCAVMEDTKFKCYC